MRVLILPKSRFIDIDGQSFTVRDFPRTAQHIDSIQWDGDCGQYNKRGRADRVDFEHFPDIREIQSYIDAWNEEKRMRESAKSP